MRFSCMGSVPWQRGLTPVRLVLAGALSALLSALSEGIALYFQVGQDMAFWYAGGTAGIKWVHLKIMRRGSSPLYWELLHCHALLPCSASAMRLPAGSGDERVSSSWQER